MSAHGDRAADLLIHYFSLIAERAGVPWDGDNASEIRVAVDCLTDAATEAAGAKYEKRVRELEEALVTAEGNLRRIERGMHSHGPAA